MRKTSSHSRVNSMMVQQEAQGAVFSCSHAFRPELSVSSWKEVKLELSKKKFRSKPKKVSSSINSCASLQKSSEKGNFSLLFYSAMENFIIAAFPPRRRHFQSQGLIIKDLKILIEKYLSTKTFVRSYLSAFVFFLSSRARGKFPPKRGFSRLDSDGAKTFPCVSTNI